MNATLKLLACFFIAGTCFLFSCKNDHFLFRPVSPEHSTIHFNNQFIENDSINPIDVTNIYNGGGVGIGDFNNDGLQDIYFTGNLVPNKLYLNKGDFVFADVTQEAQAEGKGRWNRGVAVVDINNDGLLDMYVCASMLKEAGARQNLLYVNQGINKNGIPVFKDMAEAYGLNDTTHSTMAAFFDYDNDGDVDMYLVVNEILNHDIPSVFRPKITDGSHPSTGRLYRNDWSNNLGHPVFTNVSKEAGITIEGYGHGVSVADFNKDGWKDIYVTNDFNSNDLLYINNHNGTFTDKAGVYFKHTSANGMGQDVIDINNDGLSDVVELDMNPEDNYRKQTMMNAGSYQTYQNSDYYGYQYQYVRNTLQLNQGPRIIGDSVGDPVFQDIGFYSGIAETDWSWTPLVTDFDNDGYRDIVITNGFPKDITDHDFIAFRRQSSTIASKSYTLSQIPEVKIHNYGYKNRGNLTFADVTGDWGLTVPSFTNGAAYADLDNDGDMDMVMNNINDEALVYENTLRKSSTKDQHFLSVQLRGDSLNRNGLGAWVELYYGQHRQAYEQTPYRGYLSTVQLNPHFGLGSFAKVDSLVVKWPGGKKQVLKNVNADQTIPVDIRQAGDGYNWSSPALPYAALFKEANALTGIHYIHQENDFIDYDIQKLLPHKLSEYGPALAAGDVDGNGLDDIVSGGSFYYSAQLFLQQQNGKFVQKDLLTAPETKNKKAEDMGLLLFDADSDQDLDLYIASGGYEAKNNTRSYQDRIYINDGKGDFRLDSLALPKNLVSKSCVRAADYDRDGDLDLFVAGRVDPWNYPKPVSSFIYRNDSKNGAVKFTDVTLSVAPSLNTVGLVCDALWTDYDNDGWQDLLLAGEWMPVILLKNEKGSFQNLQPDQLATSSGWWNSIAPGDFDNDGDMDYILGNMGENTFYKGSAQYPISIYAKDFDNNGVMECLTTKYIKDREGVLREYPTHVRDNVVDQMPFIKKRFLTYKAFAEASYDQLFTPEEKKGMLQLKANSFKSVYLENKGNNRFEMHALPKEAQVAPLNGMIADDFDGDGNLDLLINGNDYGTDVSVGRYDALNGLLLKGDGNGTFTPLTILQGGIYIPGNGKSLVKLRSASGNYLVAASQNKGPLKIFGLQNAVSLVPLDQAAIAAYITYKNGKTQKREVPYGSSFLSQSVRFLLLDANIRSVKTIDARGNGKVLTK